MALAEISASRHRSWDFCGRRIVLVLVLLQLAGVRARRELQDGGEAVYCVAKPDAGAGQLQEALDWACGKGDNLGSVDCSAIQKGGSCFEPDTVAGHASYAFTVYYYQQNGAAQACDFKGLATLTYSNPSNGSCVYPTTSLSSNSSTSSPPTLTGYGLPNPLYISPAPSPNAAPSHRAFSVGTPFLLYMVPFLIVQLL